MNQKIKTKIEQLTSYQKSLIEAVAKRESDNLLARAQHLADLGFCTHSCKMEYLKSINFDAFFISAFEDFIDTDKKQDVQHEVPDTETVSLDTPTETPQTSADKGITWNDDDTRTFIHFYLKGTDYGTLAEMFGMTKKKVAQKVWTLKQSKKWKDSFADKEKSAAGTAIPAAEMENNNTNSIPEMKKKIKFSVRDLKVYFYDFLVGCQQSEKEEVIDVVSRYIRYLEEQVKE